MKTVEKVLLSGVAIFTFCFTINAQGYQDSLRQDDDDIVSSIAPYPADVRDAILNISQYPQKLVKLERIQGRSSQSFQDLLNPFPRATQEKFYDIARYPDLIHQLVAAGPMSADQVSALVASYPQQVAATVSELYPAHTNELKAMEKTYQDSQDAMENVIRSMPAEVQNDMRKIVGMPDVMNLLTDRIDLTVSLGEAYKDDPNGVRQNLTNLNAQLASENSKELEEYKQKVANDPQLQQEMKQSAQDFADNYSETEDGTAPTVINNYYNTSPYPYWFGYPYWYPTAIWYPRPLYYHTGFYIGAGGNMVILGLPSYGYSNWFFNYGYRRYPRMYGWYHGYYNNYRAYRPGFNVYRGYHSAVRDHFNFINRQGANYGTNGRTRPTNDTRTRSTQQTQPARERFNSQMNGRTVNPGHDASNFRNSINGSNFNQQRFNNFQSQQFHQQGWGGVRGGGMQRSSGGTMRGGFGGGGGGNHGGSRRR